MRKLIVLLLFIPLTLSLFGNKQYYKLLRRAEQCIIDEKLDSSLYYYQQAFTKYNYPFVKDIMAAACVAHYANDTATMYSHIKTMMKRGVVTYELGYFLKHRSDDKELLKIVNSSQEYKEYYLKSIDKAVADKFMELDISNAVLIHNRVLVMRRRKEYKTRKDLDRSVDVDKFIKYVNNFGFPDEKRTGLGGFPMISSVDFAKLFNKEYTDVTNRIENGREGDKYAYVEPIFGYGLFDYSCRRGCKIFSDIDIKRYPDLDNLLLNKITNLNFNPSYYIEYLQKNSNVYYVYRPTSKLMKKYRGNMDKIINKINIKEINQKRAEIFMRTVEKDIALYKAIAELEGVNYKKYFSRKNFISSAFVRSVL
jgi:hypothetical protein